MNSIHTYVEVGTKAAHICDECRRYWQPAGDEMLCILRHTCPECKEGKVKFVAEYSDLVDRYGFAYDNFGDIVYVGKHAST